MYILIIPDIEVCVKCLSINDAIGRYCKELGIDESYHMLTPFNTIKGGILKGYMADATLYDTRHLTIGYVNKLKNSLFNTECDSTAESTNDSV